LKRTDALKKAAAKQDKPQNFIILNQTNITYFTGFTGATALLIPEQGENILFVSGVNYEQAKAETQDITIQLLKRGENLVEKITEEARTKKFSFDTMPVENWRALSKTVGEQNLQPINNLIRDLRSVKSQEEIKLIREACRIAAVGMQTAKEIMWLGTKERDAAAEIEYAMRKKGSDGAGFDTIIASGAASAFPHGSCSERTIKEGDLVVVDLGAIYKFYRSDMTRTFTAGKPSEKQDKVYETVKMAHQKAFQTIKPLISAKEVDAAARQEIENAGFGEFFVHNLGHGVGLEVHEAPILSPDSVDILTFGNVVTDEPGIYLPGYGGVRIEDTVVVTAVGAEKLTIGPYTLR